MIIKRFLLIFALNAILLINGCSSIYLSVRGKVLSPHEVSLMLSGLQTQEEMVNSFYSTGTVVLKDWQWESEANSLIVGIKDPMRLKIEITHSWGRPVLHILIDKDKIEILSFEERKLYRGPNKPGRLSRFLQDIDTRHMWTVARGYPSVLEHQQAVTPGRNRITLLDNEEKSVETIYLDPEGRHPHLVSFPLSNLDIKFSGLSENEGIYYAREVTVGSVVKGKMLILKNKKMVFNKTIPDEIFLIKCPAMFEVVELD